MYKVIKSFEFKTKTTNEDDIISQSKGITYCSDWSVYMVFQTEHIPSFVSWRDLQMYPIIESMNMIKEVHSINIYTKYKLLIGLIRTQVKSKITFKVFFSFRPLINLGFQKLTSII